jgi:Plant transposon protein
MAESTASECVKYFAAAVSIVGKSRCLRDPTSQELERIRNEYAKLGFPGCAGCLDVATWDWANFPVALHGSHTGKSTRPCLRLACVCDDYLYIWCLNFGMPGAKNDLQILDRSPLFQRLRTGRWSPVRPDTMIGAFRLSWFFYLTDSIYPRWRIFVTTYKEVTH